MPSHQIAHAHDTFVRTMMSDLRIAREFLSIHLPKDIRAEVDLDQLELQPSSYINDVCKESIVDILYKTTIKEAIAYLYLLFEHQSPPDELMPFHIIKYTCDIIDSHLERTGDRKLPLVYPMLIYHGKVSYPYSTDINDIVAAPRELVDRYFLKPL